MNDVGLRSTPPGSWPMKPICNVPAAEYVSSWRCSTCGFVVVGYYHTCPLKPSGTA